MKTSSVFGILMMVILSNLSCKNNRRGDPAQNYDNQSVSQDSANNNPNRPATDRVRYDTSNKLPAPGKIDSTPLSGTVNEAFVDDAAISSMLQLALGQLAQHNAGNPRVKAFGAMMVADYTRAGNELKAIAGAKNHRLPALPGKEQQHIDRLKKKQGEDFDKAYMSRMVSDHEKVVRAYEKGAGNMSDTTVKAFARRTLPALRKHLDSARAIDRDL